MFDFDDLDEAEGTLEATTCNEKPLQGESQTVDIDLQRLELSECAPAASQAFPDEDITSDDSLSEVWPGDIPSLEPEGRDILGQLGEDDSDDDEDLPDLVAGPSLKFSPPGRVDEDQLRAWEVAIVRCVVRKEPSLDAPVAGICSNQELLFEEPGDHPARKDWVRLEMQKGYVLKDGSKKDAKLGVLVKPFRLDGVPCHFEQEVLGLLQQAWREVREQRSSFLRPPVIRKLRKASEDAVGAASLEDGSFDVRSFEFEYRRGVAALLSEQDQGFFSQAKQLLNKASAARDGANSWNHAPRILAKIDQGAVRQLIASMKQRKLPSKEDASYIVSSVTTLLAKQPSLVELDVPAGATLHVIGDVHGQFWDLLHILEMCGEPSSNNQFLINGDFVDRGQFSVEVALALLAMKVASPNCVHLNRGNHEAMRMNTIYGFMQEAEQKYDGGMFQLFCQAFKNLPVATVVNRSVFVVHGGLSSQDGVSLAQIAKLDRKREPDEQADPLMLDLLWSDPMERLGRDRSPRGGGVLFGPDVTRRFCEDNGLACMIRSHEMKQEGHEWQRQRRCLTIFSAPNYCDICGNLGAICDITPRLHSTKLTVDDLHVRTFESSPHPEEHGRMLLSSFGH